MTLHQQLALTRPLAFFDLETTGKYPDRDRIVDITITTVSPDGGRGSFSSLVNPGMPIPLGATAVHGITDDMVSAAPTFKALAPTIVHLLDGTDLAGYNVKRFDIPLLCAEFKRAGVTFSMEGRRVVDPQVIYFKREPRDLGAAFKFFTGQELDGAHRANVDVDAAIAVLEGQLARYQDLPATVDALHTYCRDASWVDESGKFVWNEGRACLGFGKHAGKSLQALVADVVGRDYLRWMVSSDFPDDTKKIIAAALKGQYPTPPAETEVARAS